MQSHGTDFPFPSSGNDFQISLLLLLYQLFHSGFNFFKVCYLFVSQFSAVEGSNIVLHIQVEFSMKKDSIAKIFSHFIVALSGALDATHLKGCTIEDLQDTLIIQNYLSCPAQSATLKHSATD